MIESGWGDDEKTYLVLSFNGKWTSADFAETVRLIFRRIREESKSIHLLIDLRYSHAPPTSIMWLIMRAIKARPQNFGRVIVVAQSNIWKRLYEATIHHQKVKPSDLHFVATVDKAYALLLAAKGGS